MASNDGTEQPQKRRDGLASTTPQHHKATDAAGNAIEASRLTPGAPGSPDRQERIARAAYGRAEKRGFAPGAEWDDWLEAEREVDAEVERKTTRSDLSDT